MVCKQQKLYSKQHAFDTIEWSELLHAKPETLNKLGPSLSSNDLQGILDTTWEHRRVRQKTTDGSSGLDEQFDRVKQA